jgi:hypothetical protein
VSTFLESVPEERRGTLVALRDLCGETSRRLKSRWITGCRLTSETGRSKSPLPARRTTSRYTFSDRDVLDTHRDRLAGVTYGKGCIRYTSPAKVDLGVVKSMLEATAASRGPIC